MYQTVWSGLEKDNVNEDITSFISTLETRFINEDGQLLVEEVDDGLEVTFEVFNDTREESTRVFEDFETAVQRNFGYNSYSMRTTNSEAVAIIDTEITP